MKHLLLILLSLSPLAAGEIKFFPTDEKVTPRAATILKLIDEPSLMGNTTDLKCLRLTYIPTFGNPFVVRLTKRDNMTHLKCVILNGKGGYDMGRVAEHREVHKTGSSIANEILQNAPKCFNNINRIADGMGSDGSRWILEYVDGHDYQFADLWSPSGREGNEDFVITCRWLCEFAGVYLQHENNFQFLDPLIEEEFQILKQSRLYLIVNQEPTDVGPTDPFADPNSKDDEVDPVDGDQ